MTRRSASTMVVRIVVVPMQDVIVDRKTGVCRIRVWVDGNDMADVKKRSTSLLLFALKSRLFLGSFRDMGQTIGRGGSQPHRPHLTPARKSEAKTLPPDCVRVECTFSPQKAAFGVWAAEHEITQGSMMEDLYQKIVRYSLDRSPQGFLVEWHTIYDEIYPGVERS